MNGIIKTFVAFIFAYLTIVCLANPYKTSNDIRSTPDQLIRTKRDSFCGRYQACGWQEYDKENEELESFQHNPSCHCRSSQKCLKQEYESSHSRYVYKCWKPRA